jgi:hypothetical protein
MGTCSQTNIPVLNTIVEPCDGVYKPTSCVVHESAILSLGYPQEGALLSNIIATIASAIATQNTLINEQASQIDNLQSQITSLQELLETCCPQP